MARVAKSSVALRISGDDLDPEEITRLLGPSPKTSKRKGDKTVSPKSGREWVAKTGLWMLEAEDREPESIDGQIEELLKQLTGELGVWEKIADRFEVVLICGLFMEGANEGMSLSPRSLMELGRRRIELWFDIYGGADEQRER